MSIWEFAVAAVCPPDRAPGWLTALSVLTDTERLPWATAQLSSSSAAACAQYRYTNTLAPSEVVQVRRSLYGIRIGAKISF